MSGQDAPRMPLRLVLGVVGVALGCYGLFLLLSRGDAEDWRSAGVWLIGGVVAHDVVLAGVTLLVGLVVTRLLPDVARPPATVALVVMGSLTLIAVPMLGRFGAREDNPTLLDRPYVASWLVLVALTVAAVVVVSLVRARRRHAGGGVRHAAE